MSIVWTTSLSTNSLRKIPPFSGISPRKCPWQTKGSTFGVRFQSCQWDPISFLDHTSDCTDSRTEGILNRGWRGALRDSSQTSQRFSQSISPSLGDRGEAILGDKADSLPWLSPLFRFPLLLFPQKGLILRLNWWYTSMTLKTPPKYPIPR